VVRWIGAAVVVAADDNDASKGLAIAALIAGLRGLAAGGLALELSRRA
jgi:predicted dinucleotide-binding enzyme